MNKKGRIWIEDSFESMLYLRNKVINDAYLSNVEKGLRLDPYHGSFSESPALPW